MTHFRHNLRDLEFNLFEVFGADKILDDPAFADLDVATAREILTELARLSQDELASGWVEGDRNPPVFDPATHSVTLPESFKKAYKAFIDAEYWRLDLPEVLGGTMAPRMLWWSLAELVLGANPALWMYAAGSSFAHTAHLEGTLEQQEWAKLFVEKGWGATMVLTEPDAGSDVGAGTTKAYKQPDGSWHIEGVKRFITSGDQDMTDNIIHYVLARPVGEEGVGGPGTKGLSLFIVPKFLFDPATGELGERNGVNVTNLEHKMGLKVSATAELTFGEKSPAKGWLLGEKHEGIRQMFLIIEYARMMVGTKAIATLSTGYLNALDYAKSRIQGPDLLKMADKASPRVPIIKHPDVRRSLLMQKSYAEGLRALVAYTASWQDKSRLAEIAGDDESAETAKKVNDLLLPLVKGCGSERAYQLLSDEALQTFGGSGYLQDYPLEQYVRDAKIDTLYEGTTAIQSLDFLFRKILKDNGESLMVVAGEIMESTQDGHAELEEVRGKVLRALGDVQGILEALQPALMAAMGDEPRELYKTGLHSRRLLLAVGDLMVGWLLLRQAEIAQNKLDEGADDDFYRGKVAAAKFFSKEVLPRLTADRKVVESADLTPMDLPDEAF
ncbi:acyl-CoA dehydrogenase [Glycomyces algeriensis]|uniref:Broad-specificity linear acyl-CoA dehydrogenase FadE5 n=1 Tax=Glycomyces algeriensis TaxID=256037 RepID=A0A9W6G6T2_9ACTN|nr:acyl-CoA dehydrogenase [Glycomyces algeriensis]MDA1366296.1 acyl-CoA dehydrogenase [Glycomyces algeriensis]MDR7348641.1 alkylation response protein AidB-like acyl-CoA dehydrogenase [Glycomyces algeriensis]GLI41343.1 acyl-CoA dehydrogenase [Glycomyces algeriensis]